jgi:hypothetical protein
MARWKLPDVTRGWPRRVQGFPGPEHVDDTVVITTPNEDSSVFAKLQTLFVEADNANEVYFAGPPTGKFWVVYYGSGYHNDSAKTVSWAQLVLQNPLLVVVIPLEGVRDMTASGTADETADKVILTRPVIVHPPWTLGIQMSGGVAVGKKVRSRILLLELDQGQVVPRGA